MFHEKNLSPCRLISLSLENTTSKWTCLPSFFHENTKMFKRARRMQFSEPCRNFSTEYLKNKYWVHKISIEKFSFIVFHWTPRMQFQWPSWYKSCLKLEKFSLRVRKTSRNRNFSICFLSHETWFWTSKIQLFALFRYFSCRVSNPFGFGPKVLRELFRWSILNSSWFWPACTNLSLYTSPKSACGAPVWVSSSEPNEGTLLQPTACFSCDPTFFHSFCFDEYLKTELILAYFTIVVKISLVYI